MQGFNKIQNDNKGKRGFKRGFQIIKMSLILKSYHWYEIINLNKIKINLEYLTPKLKSHKAEIFNSNSSL